MHNILCYVRAVFLCAIFFIATAGETNVLNFVTDGDCVHLYFAAVILIPEDVPTVRGRICWSCVGRPWNPLIVIKKNAGV